MIKAGIIGCGKVADQHAVQMQRIPGVEIVGVCDSEPLMAQQMRERFKVERHFTNAQEMLDAVNLDDAAADRLRPHLHAGARCRHGLDPDGVRMIGVLQ